MTLYLLKEIACCVVLAAALVGFAGGSVLAWKTASSLVRRVRQAPALLTRSPGRCLPSLAKAGSERMGWWSKTAPNTSLTSFVFATMRARRNSP